MIDDGVVHLNRIQIRSLLGEFKYRVNLNTVKVWMFTAGVGPNQRRTNVCTPNMRSLYY